MQSAYHYQPTAQAQTVRPHAGPINMKKCVLGSESIRSARCIHRGRIGRALQTGMQHASFGISEPAF